MRSFLKRVKQEIPGRIEELTGLRIIHRPRPARRTADDPDLVVHAGGYSFVIEAKASARVAMVAHAARRAAAIAPKFGERAVPLVVVPYMGEAGYRACMEQGAGYLDLSGNAHLEAPGFHVHVEGKPNLFKERGRPATPFAPKSARVARSLLHDPDRYWMQKELAEATGLGAGFVSKLVRRLEEDDLLERDQERRIRPRDPDLLLDAWAGVHDLKSSELLRLHVPEPGGPALMQRLISTMVEGGIRYSFTGLAAAWRYDAFAAFRLVSIYCDIRPSDSWLEHVGGRSVDSGANLWWIIPRDEGVFDYMNVIDQAPCCCPVQVYLDLLVHPERAQEAARTLRKNHLRLRRDAG